MVTSPSLVPRVAAATTATAKSNRSQMTARIDCERRLATGGRGSQGGERVVRPRHRDLTRLRRHLLDEVARQHEPARGMIEIFLERGIRHLQVGLRRVELAAQECEARLEQAQLEVLSHEEGL